MNLDSLLTLATHCYGTAYAALLKADIEIARRERDNPPVPQSWLDKRNKMARKLDRERARFDRESLEAKREFWQR